MRSGLEYGEETSDRRGRTSQKAKDVALSKKLSALPERCLHFVRYLYRAKADNRIYYWLQANVSYRAIVTALRISRRSWRFRFNGREYRYFYHPYHWTWRGERAVELPVILEEVEKVDAERVLELGNVLSHYYDVHHDIVDKYERGDCVITSDICDFHTPKTYDLIVSISTIEHIGLDEDPAGGETLIQPRKSQCVIRRLKRMLSENGKLLVTVPLGHNLALDRLLKDDTMSIFTKKTLMKRISKSNKWAEVEESEIRDAKYGSPFDYANVLAICSFESSAPR